MNEIVLRSGAWHLSAAQNHLLSCFQPPLALSHQIFQKQMIQIKYSFISIRALCPHAAAHDHEKDE